MLFRGRPESFGEANYRVTVFVARYDHPAPVTNTTYDTYTQQQRAETTRRIGIVLQGE